MTDNNCSFIKCVIHESKKAYKWWAFGIASILALIGVGYVFYKSWDTVTQPVVVIYNLFVSLPWWVYVIAALITIPIVYSTIKCYVMRNGGFDFVMIFILGGSFIALMSLFIESELMVILGVSLIGSGIAILFLDPIHKERI